VSLLWLKETVRNPVSLAVFLRLRRAPGNVVLQGVAGGTDAAAVGAAEDPVPAAASTDDSERPLPLRALLTRDVLVAGGNYASLSLLDIAFRSLHPLFLSTPRMLGGLGLEPPLIGVVSISFLFEILYWRVVRQIVAVYGLFNGFFQVFLFARINDRFGSKNVVRAPVLGQH
jgi:hypothetical protein